VRRPPPDCARFSTMRASCRIRPRTSRNRLRLRLLAPDGLRRLVFSQPFEGGMADSAITGPGGKFHLGDQLRLRPSGVLGVWPGDGDERRCLPADSLERCHDGPAELYRPAGADRPGVDQASAVIIVDEERAQIWAIADLVSIAPGERRGVEGTMGAVSTWCCSWGSAGGPGGVGLRDRNWRSYLTVPRAGDRRSHDRAAE
jgi:hypothetical protein